MGKASKKSGASKGPKQSRMPSPDEFREWLERVLLEGGLRPVSPEPQKK